MDDFKKHLANKMLPIGYMSIKNWTHPRHRKALEEIDTLVDHHNLPTSYIDIDPETIKKFDKLDESESSPTPNHDYLPDHKLVKIPYQTPHEIPEYESKNYNQEYEDLSKHFPSRKDLSDEEAHHVWSYTHSSKDLNKALVRAHHMGNSLDNQYQEHHDHLMRVAARSQTPHDLILWSGVGKANPGVHKKMLMPAYSSMTISPGIASSFARPDSNLAPHESKRILMTMDSKREGHQHLMSPEDAFHWAHLNGDLKDIPRSPEHNNQLTAIARKYGHVGEHHEGRHWAYGQGAQSQHLMHVLRINVPKGSNLIYPGEMSNYKSEKELIAPPKSVVSLRENEPVHIDKGGRVYWPVDLHTPKISNSPIKRLFKGWAN